MTDLSQLIIFEYVDVSFHFFAQKRDFQDVGFSYFFMIVKYSCQINLINIIVMYDGVFFLSG